MTTLLFQGQCTSTLFLDFLLLQEFKEYTSLAEKIIGISLKKEDLAPDKNKKYYQFNQPLTFLMNHLHFLKLRQKFPKMHVDFLLGHSLGEYNALVVAESMDFEEALKLIENRRKKMQKIKQGHMMAVLGLTRHLLTQIIKDNGLENDVEVSVINGEKYLCLSYLDIKKVQCIKLLKKVHCHLLNIPFLGPYHSNLMQKAQWEFGWDLDEITFGPPKIPIISNYKAIPYFQADIRFSLYQHITHPVLWNKSIKLLLACGEKNFIECHPKKVLSSRIPMIQLEDCA